MPIAKLRAPEGVTAFSHEGHAADIGRDGTVLVDHRHMADYIAHGFVPHDEAPRAAADVQAERRYAADPRPPMPVPPAPAVEPEVAAFLSRLAARPGSLEKLAALIEGDTLALGDPRAEPPLPEAQPQTAADASSSGRMTDEQINAMPRKALVEACNARGLPIERPIDDDVLRAKLIHARDSA